MLHQLTDLHPVAQALLATLFTWSVTALGAATVFFAARPSRRLLNVMMGFAAGVMLAASYWSLLDPAISLARGLGVPSWLPAAVGFLLGGGFLYLLDRLLPHLHPMAPEEETEGLPTRWHRTLLVVLAITLHNVPEGLAVGVAFGAVAAGMSEATLAAALALALGIGLQNFPEGLAVSLPLRREGLSRSKSFFMGQASGIVEPIAGVLGAASVLLMQSMLPYALSFAAGAMIYVVVEELIPESQSGSDTHMSTWGAMLGFTVMMLLDVGLG
ncbi:MAG: Zinc transporter ZupT [Chloroflexi bacterium ADurb.Bin325]|nr:MAG: Zinc transporter ZupT [Chloroflexi bacterium ADurb.Bin325]